MNARTAIALAAGLLLGVAATILFQDSMPPPAGTAEAKVDKLQSELSRANSRIAKLETLVPKNEPTTADKARAGAADILDDLRHGRPVDADKVFQRIKPALRDLAPVFDSLRRKEQRREFARIAAHMSEAYHLDAAQQRALEQWLGERAIQDAQAFNAIAFAEHTTLEDMMRAAKYKRPDRALDDFMERTLSGGELQRFKSDRALERTKNLENEANSRVFRLHQAVQLDEAQQDRVFSIMARSSPDFVPGTKLDIPAGNDARVITHGQDRDKAILEVLRPEQRRQYESYRLRQRQEAEKEAAEMGIKLPANWDLFEPN